MAEPRRRRPLAPLIKLSLALPAVGVAALPLAPAAWKAILGVLATNHLLLAAAGMSPRCRLLGPNLSRLPPAAAARGEVALTFDDGPDPEITPAVLEILVGYRARATFFVVGHRAERHPEIVLETVRIGHSVQNHTYSHSSRFALRGPRSMANDIDRAQEVIARLIGNRPGLFRAPAGIRSPFLDPLLARRGLDLVSWTRRGFDTVASDPEWVTRRLVGGLAAGDILLLHDGRATTFGGSPTSVIEVLPRLLEVIQERGLKPVTLTEAGAKEPAR